MSTKISDPSLMELLCAFSPFSKMDKTPWTYSKRGSLTGNMLVSCLKDRLTEKVIFKENLRTIIYRPCSFTVLDRYLIKYSNCMSKKSCPFLYSELLQNGRDSLDTK